MKGNEGTQHTHRAHLRKWLALLLPAFVLAACNNAAPPVDIETVLENDTFSITVSGDIISFVDFYLDGALSPYVHDESSPFEGSLDTTGLSAGEHVVKVVVAVDVLSAASTVTRYVPFTVESNPDPPPPPPPPPPGLGTLSIDVTPDDAGVSVSGPNGFSDNFSGDRTLTDLEPGSYTVDASKSGYQDASDGATVNAGETAQVAITLQADPGPGPGPGPNPNVDVRILSSYSIRKSNSDPEPFYLDLKYRPNAVSGGAYDGWDVFETDNLSGVYRSVSRSDWLHLNLNRPAVLAVVWYGSSLPGWLSGWNHTGSMTYNGRSGTVYERSFSAGPVELGGVEGRAAHYYTVLFGESDGSASVYPSAPSGLQQPSPNTVCPTWVHDRYVAEAPDGSMYRTWHGQIDTEYWCYFEHEHGSDPSLVGDYEPYFEYVAYHNNRQNEPHNGFKGYSILDVDGGDGNSYNWYINAHMGTARAGRVCAVVHTVTVAVFNANSGQMVAELAYKADFGTARANSLDNPVLQPPTCLNDLHEVATQTTAEKQFRVANAAPYTNEGYETWRGGGNNALGYEAHAMIFDNFNPMTSCNGLNCSSVVPTGSSGEKRNLVINAGSSLAYDASLDPDGNGYFYTDQYGENATWFNDHPDGNFVRQFVLPGLDIVGPNGEYNTQDAWLGGFFPGRRNTPEMQLEDGLGSIN